MRPSWAAAAAQGPGISPSRSSKGKAQANYGPSGRPGDRRANALARETIRDEELSQLAGVALFRTGLTLETDVTGALNLAAHPAPPEEGYQWQQK
jgi:hypothetical protein